MKKLTNNERVFLVDLLASELGIEVENIYHSNRAYFQELSLKEIKRNKKLEKQIENEIKEKEKFYNNLIEKIK